MHSNGTASRCAQSSDGGGRSCGCERGSGRNGLPGCRGGTTSCGHAQWAEQAVTSSTRARSLPSVGRHALRRRPSQRRHASAGACRAHAPIFRRYRGRRIPERAPGDLAPPSHAQAECARAARVHDRDGSAHVPLGDGRPLGGDE
eukprot:scaffold6282_cov119-Isochrysis_galbana.AAC.4